MTNKEINAKMINFVFGDTKHLGAHTLLMLFSSFFFGGKQTPFLLLRDCDKYETVFDDNKRESEKSLSMNTPSCIGYGLKFLKHKYTFFLLMCVCVGSNCPYMHIVILFILTQFNSTNHYEVEKNILYINIYAKSEKKMQIHLGE